MALIKCNECGKEMDIPGLLDANMKSIENKCKVDEKIFDDMLSSLSNFFGVLNVK